jgi:group I intron endonuclease
MKQCEECQIEKELTEFANSRHTADGLQRRCKPCRKSSRKQNQLKKRQEGTCTIYLLTNIINLKIYVGQTWMALEERPGKNGVGYSNSPYLYNAIQKYGFDNFQYTVLTECHDQMAADVLEDEYIEQLDSCNPAIGYNLKKGGSAGKHSEETKNKISEALKGREVSEETRQKLSVANTGIKKPPHTEEWKEDNSLFMKQRHKENGHPMQGKQHTEESKAQISETIKESWHETHTEASIARSAKNRMMKGEMESAIVQAYQNGETIANIETQFGTGRSSIYRVLKRNNIPLLANHTKSTGKKHSDETKALISQLKQEWWDKRKE